MDFQRDHDIVNVTIRDVNNGEITGLGTGFQRMKQLAIVMAVISSKIGDEKMFDYPFISDAPFLSLVKISSIISLLWHQKCSVRVS